MEQVIEKAALVAEIEKCYNECLNRAKITDSDYWNAKADAYRNVLVIFDDTLEVKEVDLEKEIECSLPKPAWGWNEDYFGKSNPAYSIEQMKEFAKHFFELGIKTQKGE